MQQRKGAYMGITLESVSKLTKDLKEASLRLSQDEARFLVDYYYQIQKFRISGENQIRSMGEEPHAVLDWLSSNTSTLERSIARALDAYSSASKVGQWSKSIYGIGPIISAGLLAHINIEKAPSVGHIWSFAGLDPRNKWEKGQKRPWNASLKTLCWKIGESFVKVSGKPESFYGQVYLRRKEEEIAKNEQLTFKEQADGILKTKKIGKDTDAYAAYSQGKLPPAHIHARAKRVAVKLFLSHWHYIAYEERFGKPPENPYAIAIMGHAHMIPPWEAS